MKSVARLGIVKKSKLLNINGGSGWLIVSCQAGLEFWQDPLTENSSSEFLQVFEILCTNDMEKNRMILVKSVSRM